MRTALILLAVSLAAAGCGAPRNETGAAFTATGEIIALGGGEGGAANACFTCHGANGEGDGVSTPRLAGLTAGYIEKQLADYARGLRPDKVMAPVAAWLDDQDRQKVAAFYADMPVEGIVETLAPAPEIYTTGGCAACHGVNGEGVGPANPSIAGQPAAYTRDQLWRFKRADRRNDPLGVMVAAAAPLNVAQIDAIAAWLATRSPARTPDTVSASLSAARTESARWAPSRETHPSAR